MKRMILTACAVLAVGMLGFAGSAVAQEGHFVTGGANAPSCTDQGTTLLCTGKVAGLGGTTFEIQVEAEGTASVECANPAGNVAPGQDTSVTAEGTTGELPTPRNGQFEFGVSTVTPTVPNFPTCPNPMWTANVVDVVFTSATLTLLEDGQPVDTFTITL